MSDMAPDLDPEEGRWAAMEVLENEDLDTDTWYSLYFELNRLRARLRSVTQSDVEAAFAAAPELWVRVSAALTDHSPEEVQSWVPMALSALDEKAMDALPESQRRPD